MKKISLFLVLALITLLTISAQLVSASAATDTNGLKATTDNTFDMQSKTYPLPLTLEATIYLPSSQSSRAGVIVGNYVDGNTPCFNLEIYTGNTPRILIISNSTPSVTYDIKFDKVRINNETLTRLAITLDPATGDWNCYVDGVLKQTVNHSNGVPAAFNFNSDLRAGGDFRKNNTQAFKGIIQKINLYSDVRTAQEISSDLKGNLDKDNIILSYDFSSYKPAELPSTIKCSANSGLDLTRSFVWSEDVPLDDYAYSFAILGDIQSLNYYHPEKLPMLYNWVRDNAASQKMKLCIGLGDITDKNTQEEYDRAKTEFQKLNGIVPFTFIRGNHDKIPMYSQNMLFNDWSQYTTGSFDNTTMLDTYYKFQVGNVKYLIINLDLALREEALNWANDLITNNPDHQVIVTTHVYKSKANLYYNLDTLNTKKYGAPGKVENIGQGLWDKVLSKHENVVMMICGHNPTPNVHYWTQTGANGNKVAEFLIDPQQIDLDFNGLGMVAMFYFSEDGKNVQIRYYSTVKKAYYLSENQFNVTLDVPGDNTHTIGKTEYSSLILKPQSTQAPSTSTNAPDDNTNQLETKPQTSTPSKNNALVPTVISVVSLAIVATIIVLVIKKKKKSSIK